MQDNEIMQDPTKVKMSTKHQLAEFHENGYVVIEDFISQEDVAKLKSDCYDLVEEMDPAKHQTIFSTTKQSYRDDYFIKSADRISYFFEDGALDKEGKLVVDKQKSLNKIGHALHILCPNYRRVTHSDLVKKVTKNLAFKDPVINQSMYIFKQPKIGGEVNSHQDASYLYTEPLEGKVIGLWMALEDATEENGCLWFIPGSHKAGLDGNHRMVRNPSPSGQSCIFTGEKPEFDQEKFIPVPIKAGSCILIDGLVVHKSAQNTSDKSRHIYTFHIYDHGTAEWSKDNWNEISAMYEELMEFATRLQDTDKKTFSHLYDVTV